MRKAFERAGINQFIHKAYTPKEIGFKKPDLRFFSEIIRKNGHSPEETVMIGNDYKKDIVPAKKTGIHTIYYTNDTDSAEYKNADFIMRDMSELSGIVKLINSF